MRDQKLLVLKGDLSWMDSDDNPRYLRSGTVLPAGDPLVRAHRDMFGPLDTSLLICREGASFDYRGVPFQLNPGDVVRAGHPLLEGRWRFFGQLEVTYEWPEPE